MARITCEFAPRTPGYAPCKRDWGHSGPCAHEPLAKSAHRIEQFPHCDQRVLHAPTVCEYCDLHPEWQELRVTWGIAFTGGAHTDNGLTECPADRARPHGQHQRWHGNRPETVDTKIEREAYWREVEESLRAADATHRKVPRRTGGPGVSRAEATSVPRPPAPKPRMFREGDVSPNPHERRRRKRPGFFARLFGAK